MKKPKALYVELRNMSYGRQLFSAVTPDMSRETFLALWNQVGEHVYNMGNAPDPSGQIPMHNGQWSQFELRISPVTD